MSSGLSTNEYREGSRRNHQINKSYRHQEPGTVPVRTTSTWYWYLLTISYGAAAVASTVGSLRTIQSTSTVDAKDCTSTHSSSRLLSSRPDQKHGPDVKTRTKKTDILKRQLKRRTRPIKLVKQEDWLTPRLSLCEDRGILSRQGMQPTTS
jgi:hypothetical protein